MFNPEIDPKDLAAIEAAISNYFITSPHNNDGTLRQSVAFSPQESKALVAKVLSELGHRCYAVMKPKP